MALPTSLIHTPLTTGELASALAVRRHPSELVAIDASRVALMAEHIRSTFDLSTHGRARWDDPLFWNSEAGDWERSQYFAVGNAINFRFWYFDEAVFPAGGTIDGATYRGSMYMWRCLRRAYDSDAIDLLDASFLAQLTRRQFDAIFSDDAGVNPLGVAGEERIANLRDLGQRLLTDWDGRFFKLVEASNRSLAEFARLCSSIRAFDDPVFKLTMVNAILHLGSGVYEFADEP